MNTSRNYSGFVDLLLPDSDGECSSSEGVGSPLEHDKRATSIDRHDEGTTRGNDRE